MTTIAVKPHPDLDTAAWPLLVHPVSGGLLDATKQVPDDGRPWLNDGFTCRMLTDGAILRADDPAFDAPAEAPAPAAAPLLTKQPTPSAPAASLPSTAAKIDPAS